MHVPIPRTQFEKNQGMLYTYLVPSGKYLLGIPFLGSTPLIHDNNTISICPQ